MARYTVTIGNTKYPITPGTFWKLAWPFGILALIAVAFIVAYFWCLVGGLYKFGGLWAVFGVTILTVSVTVNGVEKAILPNPFRGIFTFAATVFAFYYYFFG